MRKLPKTDKKLTQLDNVEVPAETKRKIKDFNIRKSYVLFSIHDYCITQSMQFNDSDLDSLGTLGFDYCYIVNKDKFKKIK